MSAFGIVLWIALAVLVLWMATYFLPASLDHLHATFINVIALVPLLWIPLAVLAVLAAAKHCPAQAICSVAALAIDVLLSAGYLVALPDTANHILGMPEQSRTLSVAERQAALDSCTSITKATGAATGSSESDTANSTDTADTENTADTAASTAASCVTVMTINTRYGNADASAIVHAVRQYNVDVLAVQEASADLQQRLTAEGIGNELPHMTAGNPTEEDNGGFNILFSRMTPVAQVNDAVDIDAATVPAQTLQVGGLNVTFASVHTASPHRGAQRWAAGLDGIARLGAPSGAGANAPVIVMGDFNSNSTLPSFRAALRNGGLIDASYELHSGTHLSWPASWGVAPAMLELDHVVHTQGVTALNQRTLTVPRTDHKAQIVTLRVDGAAQ
ncbi:MAG: endonuclease/exonuclease/phosphatase family protein [Bifidobacteriaceae bacterium]|nr:endonuclease/exonuclease/phosphatase family protein [Bifidobacteriaceae bacterium]